MTSIVGDMKDPAAYRALGGMKFDVVAQFMVFTPEQMAEDIATFAGNTKQYIFISSASVYEKPARHYIITEKTPTVNPYWGYSQAKIACGSAAEGVEEPALDHRAAQPHGAHRAADDDGRGRYRHPPHAAGQARDRRRRRHLAVDADALGGFRRAVRQPVRQAGGAERGFPHHLGPRL